MHVNPYLTFDGDCEEAFKVYEKVLGGKIVAMITHKDTPAEASVPAEWGNKILHARLLFGDNVLMASDAPLTGKRRCRASPSRSTSRSPPRPSESSMRFLTGAP